MAHAEIIEIICVLAEHGIRTRQNWINPFCNDGYFMTVVHFQFQCETLKINFTGFNDFLNFQGRTVTSSNNG